jgi:putative endonuclease
VSAKNTKFRGDFGEQAACRYLEERGYRIVTRNFRKRSGEIDIVAVHGGEVVFVEVKTRKFGSMTEGLDAVTYSKRLKIAKTAQAFLAEHPHFREMNARFDVASVVVTTDDAPRLIEIGYIEDAFDSALL